MWVYVKVKVFLIDSGVTAEARVTSLTLLICFYMRLKLLSPLESLTPVRIYIHKIPYTWFLFYKLLPLQPRGFQSTMTDVLTRMTAFTL